MRNIQTTVDDIAWAEIKKEAIDRRISLSELLREVIYRHLNYNPLPNHKEI